MADPAAYAFFPALNAILNGTSAVLIACGRHFIKQKRVAAHKRSMIAAVVCSSLFLVSYLYYHWQVGTVRFRGVGWSRPVYFTILGTHTVLAAAIVPLVATALVLALRGRFERHRRVARWAYPTWMYVNVTGVVIYVMLYQLFLR
ncbi:MAG TPA: DUF420 domain-containing protein [Terriglobales bacterium]|nr:DUF420 domain-containing protein [Terriglobales bacterium]